MFIMFNPTLRKNLHIIDWFTACQFYIVIVGSVSHSETELSTTKICIKIFS